MSQDRNALCCLILREQFGDLVSKIAKVLLKKGSCVLKYILAESALELKQVKKLLCLLIQHNIVTFHLNKKGLTEYTIHCDVIQWRLRFPRYIYCAKTLYGDAAELLVEDLLNKGQCLMSETVINITDKLNEALDASGHPRINAGLVKEKFENLAKTHFIQRCPNYIGKEVNDDSTVRQAPNEDELYMIPKMDIDGEVSRKRKRSTEGEVTPAKRSRTESREDQSEVPKDDGIYWRVNFERFHQHFRDQILVASAASKIDVKAGEVLRTFLRLCETKFSSATTTSCAMSVNEVFRALPKELFLTRHVLEMYMTMLCDDMNGMFTKVDEMSGGLYVVNFYKGLQEIAKAHLESAVQERFGSKCLRIFRVLLLKQHSKQKQIEDYAMISAKEAKELLYNMFSENFITLTEVSKTPDHAPSRTFYLFNVDIPQVARIVQQRCFKAVKNAMIRREAEVAEHKRVLDKKERVDAIVATLADSEQKEEIVQTISPPEQEQILKVKHTVRMLDLSETQIDDTLFVLQSYLQLSTQHNLENIAVKKKR
ncbi:DNA-directed RNA polymerase III subunit RPC3-like [Ylistrum balloti]|uniref:DNA-directed RNA polymerase III subunit RPC3-like n=1 Tax=Ylistrum balloti TaxID=509963 RepID=UPI002905B1C6|nr:DNA-directed RNA polymerase III subunit RPC3-like [Ylistrum balloti]